MSFVDWCSLPPELMEAIGRKLTILSDYIRFRAVCGAWRSSTLPIPNHLPCQFPWLMLPGNDNSNSYCRAFFDIAMNNIHHLNLPELSLQHRRRFYGSCHGWLAIGEESPCIFLFNPLTRERINLPPLSSFPNVVGFDFAKVGREYLIQCLETDALISASISGMRDSFINKIVLSSTPGSSFVAVAVIIPMDVLAYCKKGEKSWKYIEGTRSYTKDVTYLNGLFYAVDKFGKVAVCDLCGDSPAVKFLHTLELILEADTQYLVNSMGELLLVAQYLQFNQDFDLVAREFPYTTTGFRLFKLVSAQEEKGWEEMTSLGNTSLFLGSVLSIALNASDFPGCKGNKIYFLDDHFDENCFMADNGVFDLDDGSFDQLPWCPSNSQLIWPPPVWITPNLC